MTEKLFRLTSEDGIPYFGTPDQINALPNEFRMQIAGQIEAAQQGKTVDAVRVPRTILVKAGWMNEENAKKHVGAPEPVHEEVQEKHPTAPAVYKDTHTPKLEARMTRLESALEQMRQQGARENVVGNCETCPLRKVAEKVLEKTLEKI